jgi:hypothetical protein
LAFGRRDIAALVAPSAAGVVGGQNLFEAVVDGL